MKDKIQPVGFLQLKGSKSGDPPQTPRICLRLLFFEALHPRNCKIRCGVEACLLAFLENEPQATTSGAYGTDRRILNCKSDPIRPVWWNTTSIWSAAFGETDLSSTSWPQWRSPLGPSTNVYLSESGLRFTKSVLNLAARSGETRCTMTRRADTQISPCDSQGSRDTSRPLLQ